ncbi:MAG: hypothetical protein ACK56I_10705, partial [bacterium]
MCRGGPRLPRTGIKCRRARVIRFSGNENANQHPREIRAKTPLPTVRTPAWGGGAFLADRRPLGLR